MNKHSNPDPPFAEAMTEPQFRALFAEAKTTQRRWRFNRSLGYHLERAAGTHSDGGYENHTFKINPQALISPGVTSSNVLITENLGIGPVLDVIPVVGTTASLYH